MFEPRECFFGRTPAPFAMSFNETRVAQPVRRVRVDALQNELWREWRVDTPSHAFVHEHDMVFDVDVANTAFLPDWLTRSIHESFARASRGGATER